MSQMSMAVVVKHLAAVGTHSTSVHHNAHTTTSSSIALIHVAAQVESKLFYLDLKRNARGRYLKIAEKGTNRERSTIIVPNTGIMWFRELFNYYAGGTNEQG